ncbi:hypothetical protein ACFE04_003940 [Oxalis oulophora]
MMMSVRGSSSSSLSCFFQQHCSWRSSSESKVCQPSFVNISNNNNNKVMIRSKLSIGDLLTTLEDEKSKIRKPSERILNNMKDIMSDFRVQQSFQLFDIFQTDQSYFKRLFNYMIINGFEPDFFLKKRLLLTVLVSGMLIHARNTNHRQLPLTHLLPWLTMLGGLSDCVYALRIKESYQRFGDVSDWGEVTFNTMILAATNFQLPFVGKQLHSLAFKMGSYNHLCVSAALIAFYTKCGTFQDAKLVFDRYAKGNVQGLNNMMAAYSFHGYDDQALALFYEMHEDGFKTDDLTFSIVIEIYARLGYLGPAHAHNTSLPDYHTWFKHLDSQYCLSAVKTLNVLLGHAHHRNDWVKTIEFFEETIRPYAKHTHVTFQALLSACICSEKAWEYFTSMTRDHGIEPDAMHYAAMIDILGQEAARHKQHLELAKLAAEEIYALQPEKFNNYINVLVNIYKSSGMFEEANGVLDTLKRKGLRMVSPSSSIEINEQTHVFFSSDKYHPQTEEIYQKEDELMEEVSRLGHVDGKISFLPDVDENEQRIVKYHSERLAIAFGLINSAERRITLRIVQDHRMCEDCHEAVKLMATATKRKIVVKDAGRFHHFENGECSCWDYW